MSVNWISAYNRLFKIINAEGDTYYSGSAFIQMAQQVDDSIPNYNEFIKQRNARRQSTSRKDFYLNLHLSGFPEKVVHVYEENKQR